MSGEQRSITEVITRMLADFPIPPAQELHVAEPVSRFLRDRYAKSIDPKPAAALLATPIVVDDDLTGGQWQLREDGETVSSGDMAPAPEGMTVIYSPITGWIAIDSDLMEQAAGWAR